MSTDLESIRREIADLDGKLDTVRDVIATSNDSASKPVVDEIMVECKKHHTSLQNATEVVLAKQDGRRTMSCSRL